MINYLSKLPRWLAGALLLLMLPASAPAAQAMGGFYWQSAETYQASTPDPTPKQQPAKPKAKKKPAPKQPAPTPPKEPTPQPKPQEVKPQPQPQTHWLWHLFQDLATILVIGGAVGVGYRASHNFITGYRARRLIDKLAQGNKI